jgi:O-antigen/teichoic acid export membrane protein
MSSSEQDLDKIARGGVLMAVGLAFTNLASFLFMAILARALGSASFGIFTLGFSVFSVASAIALLGMDKAILRYIAPAYAKGDLEKSRFILRRIARYSLASSLLVSVVIFASAGPLAESLFLKPETADSIRLFSLCITPFVLSVLGYSALQSIKNIRYQVVARNFIEPGVKLAGAVALLLIPGFWTGWPVVVLGAAFLAAAAFSGGKIRRIMGRVKGGIDAAWSDREMLFYSFPLFLTAIFSMGLFRLDVLFLGRFGTTEEVGIYGATFQMASLGAFGLTIANLVFSPYIAASFHNGEREKLEQMFKTVSRWVLILTLPFLAAVYLYSGQILSVYGESFRAGAPVLVILTCGYTVANFSGISGSVLTMAGYARAVLVNTLCTCAVAFFACFFLVPRFGMTGAALASALAMSTLSGLRFFQVYRLTGITPMDRTTIKPMVATLAAVVIFMVVDYYFYSPNNWKGVLFILPLYMGVYLAMMSFLGWCPDDTRAFMSVMKHRGKRADRNMPSKE